MSHAQEDAEPYVLVEEVPEEVPVKAKPHVPTIFLPMSPNVPYKASPRWEVWVPVFFCLGLCMRRSAPSSSSGASASGVCGSVPKFKSVPVKAEPIAKTGGIDVAVIPKLAATQPKWGSGTQ